MTDAASSTAGPIRYFDGTTTVRLGDQVATRVWLLWKKTGRVTYLPGVSKKHPEFEHHGLRWVGVKAADGMLFGEVVDPQTGCLLKRVKFVSRDSSPSEMVTPDMVFPE